MRFDCYGIGFEVISDYSKAVVKENKMKSMGYETALDFNVCSDGVSIGAYHLYAWIKKNKGC